MRSAVLNLLAAAMFATPSAAFGSDFLASPSISGGVLGLADDGSGNAPTQDFELSEDADFVADATPASNGILDVGLSAELEAERLAKERADALGFSEEERAEAARFEERTVGDSTIYAPKTVASNAPVAVSAEFGWKGETDELGEVYVLCGDCRVSQGGDVVSAPTAVVWRSFEPNGGTRVLVYLEGNESSAPRVETSSAFVEAKAKDDSWFGTFRTVGGVDLRIAEPGDGRLAPEEIYFRAKETARGETPSVGSANGNGGDNGNIENAPVAPLENEIGVGWSETGSGEIVEIPETARVQEYFEQTKAAAKAPRYRFQFYQRYDRATDVKSRPNSGESVEGDGKDVWLISNGFTIVVQPLDENDRPLGDALELSADQATIWSVGLENADFANAASKTTANDLDLELYLAGDVVFRQGDNVIYADRMYYDVKNFVGIVLDAELVARVPGTSDGIFRVAADKITQRGPDALFASNAWVSTSAMGEPSYRLSAKSLVAETRRTPLYDVATGRQAVDPKTGKPATREESYVVAEDNLVSIGSVPIFYWPWFATDLKERSFYLRNVKLGSDSVFGTQVRTRWNPYQLLGLSDKLRPEGTDWDLNLDYLSERGLGHGTTFVYNRDSLWGWNSRAVGAFSFYGISDKGLDNLGLGRRSVPFPNSYRYRALWKHRQELGTLGCFGDGWLLAAQFGRSSDRNFIPQYFENEWQTNSNPETRVELKNIYNNQSFGLTGAIRTNDFYTQTNWLPRLDHYWLGESLFGSNLTWYEHTKLGYGQFRTTDIPYADEDKALFRYLDWELASDSTSNSPYSPGTRTLSADGLVFTSRHEIDAPFQLGPMKATPYALGEYGFWSQGVSASDVGRLYGRLGLRLNLPVWKVDSNVESKTWYLNGLAHKMNFVVDASVSDADRNYDELVLYDQIDDWQVQEFRRRYAVTTFDGSIPLRFDERYYAIRQGLLAGNVTSPSSELADDLQLVRLGWNNRWQTKRGPVGNRRVVDWIKFDAGLNLYPNDEENFGEIPGLLDYDASWLVGDRFAVLSSGLYDVWGSGQKITRVGLQRRRPGLSSAYLGVDRLYGPIDSTYLNLALAYRTSEKWGIGFNASYDLSEGHNIGQNLTVSRVGESFVVTVEATRNESQNNWGLNLSIEPIFLFDLDKGDEGLLGLGRMN
ncbi:MAG: LPS-assembly protein LptD [Thermoguttaceae bacterium]|nr:LPS-assembly protein LptD [Thermoguttaceae bacterium]